MQTPQTMEELTAILDTRYKQTVECDKEMQAAAERHNILDKQFAVINTKLSALLWGVGVLGSAVIGVLVKMVFGT